MTKLPERLFGEPVRGWSIREGRACHVIVGDQVPRAVCGVRVSKSGPSVPEVPVGYRACRTCARWLPHPGEYD